jgi:hypothetical protein
VVWVRPRAEGGGFRAGAGVRLPNATVGTADGVPRVLEAEAEAEKGLAG